MGKYRLSRKADQDIQAIFEFGAERFGYESHSIYYQQVNADIVIARVLGQQDIGQACVCFMRFSARSKSASGV